VRRMVYWGVEKRGTKEMTTPTTPRMQKPER
jgi:hypothetical protein